MYVFDGSVEPDTVLCGGVANYAPSQTENSKVSLLIAATKIDGQLFILDSSVEGSSRNTVFINLMVSGKICDSVLVLSDGTKIERRQIVSVEVQTILKGILQNNRKNPTKKDQFFPVTGLLCSKVATAPKHIPVAIKPIAVTAPKKWVSVPMGSDNGPVGGVYEFVEESNHNSVYEQDYLSVCAEN